MKACLIAFALLCAETSRATQSFSFTNSGHTYTVTSTAQGVFYSFTGHWQYQPAVISPSALTNYQYVMLFNSNVGSRTIAGGEAIYMLTSANGINASGPPVAILSNTLVSNLCDMADARPIWDGALWHVYVQGAPGNYTTGQCPGPSFIAEATGPSLTQLSWKTNPGSNTITQIVSGTGVGIGEDQQWFNTGPYGGYPPAPIMYIYNNWGYNPGGQMFGYLTNFTAYDYWYNVAQAYSPNVGSIYPDAIFDSPAGSSSGTNPAIGVANACTSGQTYIYMNGIGFYSSPTPYPAGTPQPGQFIAGSIESMTHDANGQRGARARFARNQYGYIDLSMTGPNTWTTFLYYNDGQWSKNSGDNCGYTNWGASDQRFAVTKVTITQQ